MNKRSLFYLISFIEGASVMATEIIGAKLLAPLFGSSLYVWSSVMALTLGGLAAGYFFGGRISQKENSKRILFFTFFVAGIFIIAIPVILNFLAPLAFSMNLMLAVIICSAAILLPAVFCMGMISPLIIQNISTEKDGGKRAGEIYAISTLGGIIATFLTGFYLIPTIGLTYPLFIFGFLMIACSLVYFGVKNGKTLLLVSGLIAASSFLVAAKNEDVKNVIYKSEGLLGKLEVLETHWDMDSTRRGENHRILLINNIIQTWTETTTKKSYLDYVDQIEEVAIQIKKDRPKALILGLGGGAVANMLTEKGFDVTCVELDTRIAFVAKKYFALSDKVKVIEDDARHAIERMDEKFDFVLVDLFNGEVTPSHVLSNESFERLKKITTDSTLVLFNTYGYCKVPAGLGNLALLNTIKKSGYNYTIGWTGEINKEDFRNFVIVSSRTWLPSLTKEFTEKIDLNGAELITDDKPVLEFLNAKAAKRWRYYYLQSFIPGRDNAYPEEK